MNWLDKTIAAFSPVAGLERAKARALLQVAQRHYEGATKGRRGGGWTRVGSGSSADSASFGGLSTLIARSRDDIRNNGYIERAIRAIQTETIGTGIIPTATGSAGKVKAFESLWKEWGDTEACDFDGHNDFYGLQGLIMRAVASDGGVLVRRRVAKKLGDLPVPMQLQLLEIDYLDTSKSMIVDGNRIIRGIEIDNQGRPVAYWLYNEHPGAVAMIQGMRDGWTSHRVPASEILHIYRKDRVGQLLGVPWGAPAMLTSKNLDIFEDAVLEKQIVAACFAAFVTDTEQPQTTLTEAQKTEYGKIEPATIEFLPNGKDIKFSDPPGDVSDLHAVRAIRKMAIAYGITYEVMSGDYSQVNFSSGRMGWMQMQRNLVTWRNEIVIPLFCRPAANWFAEAAEFAGRAAGPIGWTWTPPRREMIDPTKELAADKMAIRSGLKSWAETVREGGRDPEDVLKEIVDYNKKMDELGIIVDSDPRRRSNIGYNPNGVGKTLDEAEDEKEAKEKALKDEEDQDEADEGK